MINKMWLLWDRMAVLYCLKGKPFLNISGKTQFGDVFLAKARGIRPGEIETQVVVKSLITKEEHHFYEFQREIEMYSRLDQNNVIKVLGVCRETDPQFYIMEHCDWVSESVIRFYLTYYIMNMYLTLYQTIKF